MKSIFKNLFQEWQNKESMYVSYITFLFYQILIQCSRMYLDKQPTDIPEEKNAQKKLTRFLSFLNAYMEKTDVISLYEQI